MRNWTAVTLAKNIVLFVEAEGNALRRAQFGSDAARPPEGWAEADRKDTVLVLRQAARELKQYMAGKRQTFSVIFEVDGTEFQCRVWQELCGIGYGEVRSYGEIAKALERPGAARAVGAANGQNPLPVFIPCHRVIGSDGAMGGYSGGVEIKRALLKGEGVRLKG